MTLAGASYAAFFPSPHPIFPLPWELHVQIAERLSIKDQASLALTCRFAKELTDYSLRLRAHEYGYPSHFLPSTEEAKPFLGTLLKLVRHIESTGNLPRALNHFEKKKKRRLFFFKRTVKRWDVECTLLNMARVPFDLLRTLQHIAGKVGFESEDQLRCFWLKQRAVVGDPSPVSFQEARDAMLFAADDPKFIEWLLDLGANPNVKDDRGNTPLLYAKAKDCPRRAEVLLRGGADPNVVGKTGFASLAVHFEQPGVTKLLLEHGADPNFRLPVRNYSVLHLAVCENQRETCRFLLSFGADPNLQNSEAMTPLFMAAVKGLLDLTKMLLEHNADPNIFAEGGWSALASSTSRPEIAELLLRHGADPNLPSPVDGYTALHVATALDHRDTCRLLLSFGANPNLQDSEGRTPLFLAALSRNLGLVKELLEYNADPNFFTNRGSSPLSVCISDPEITDLLLKHGALPIE